MNMRKSAMFAVVLVAAQMFSPAVAENVQRKVETDSEIENKTNLCEEIVLLTDKTFEATCRNRDYSAIGQFVSKVDALTGGGRQVDERAHEAFLDLLKRLVDFQSDDQEVRMCVYEAQVRLVSRILPHCGAPSGFSVQMRRKMSERLKDFLKYLDDRIIPNFKPRSVYMNVPLPEEAWPYIKVQTNDCVFLNVDAVSDPKVRQLWEKDIEDNHKNAMLNSEQRALAEMKEHYGNRIAKAINVLSKDEETSADSNGKHQGPANVDSGKVNVSGSDKGPYAFDAVFTLRKDRGIYSIEDMALPKSDNLNQKFDKAVAVGKRLIVAINDRDLNAAKETVSFGNAADFESELAIRGLSWIKNAIDHRVTIPEESMIMSRDGKEMLVGRVKVPCAPDGSNILRMVVFKDGKIDCAAPREETKDELDRRNKAKSEERRRQGEVEARNRGLLRQNSSR